LEARVTYNPPEARSMLGSLKKMLGGRTEPRPADNISVQILQKALNNKGK
jgi:hypothetical protein